MAEAAALILLLADWGPGVGGTVRVSVLISRTDIKCFKKKQMGGIELA